MHNHRPARESWSLTFVRTNVPIRNREPIQPDGQWRSAPRVEGDGYRVDFLRKLAVAFPCVAAGQRDLQKSPALAFFIVLQLPHQVSASHRFKMADLSCGAVQRNERATLPAGDVRIDRFQPNGELLLVCGGNP